MREKQIKRSPKSQKFEVFDHFLNASTIGNAFFSPFNFQSTFSNTGAGIQLVPGNALNPGILRLLSGTVPSNDGSGSRTSLNINASCLVAGVADIELEFLYRLPVVPVNNTLDMEYFMGFGDSVIGSPANGAYIYYDYSTTPTPYIQCLTRNSTSGVTPAPSTTALSKTLQTTDWTKCSIKLPKTGSAIFTFNDTDIVTISTAVPTTTSVEFVWRKFGGTTNEGLDIDYIKLSWNR